ncbi:hypothetical protein C2S53_010150 [Perilla frutescens var. hirtella]|uniref:Uncharacterized protein n=1 Tax=Perilla frutescens var. hirtella TaxID=608512 RepID=A0AAD4NWF5_PERFH|nr:hypothetical protein C2S53_010150 [Perilla frutescens var. hirtella]
MESIFSVCEISMHLDWIDGFNRKAPAKFRLSPPLILLFPSAALSALFQIYRLPTDQKKVLGLLTRMLLKLSEVRK